MLCRDSSPVIGRWSPPIKTRCRPQSATRAPSKLAKNIRHDAADTADVGASSIFLVKLTLMRLHTQVSMEVLGTGTDGTESSVVFSVKKHGIYSDDVTVVQRYMFNCGEGTQRLCNEHGLKLGFMNTLFLSRVDPLTCSGIPGMILALGTCGTRDLDIVGPVGTHAFVASTKSFARRNYPVITCTEVDLILGQPTPQDDHIKHVAASSHAPVLEDAFVCITPVSVRKRTATRTPPPSISCRQCETSTAPSVAGLASQGPAAARPAPKSTREQRMVAWLTGFYQAKDASKVPYVHVILNKYQGRHDELRRMLFGKYGAMPVPSSSSESGSSDDNDDDDDDDDDKSGDETTSREGDKENTDRNTTPPTSEVALEKSTNEATSAADENDEASASSSEDDEADQHHEDKASMEAWLSAFYKKHNPAMLARLPTVLKTYQGREDQLKRMLEQKYTTIPSSTTTHNDDDTRPTKKAKTADDDIVAAVARETFLDPSPSPPPLVFHHDQLVLYVLEFKGTSPCVVWVVDVPDTTWLTAVADRLTACATHRPALVVHFTGSHLARHPQYVQWVTSNSTDCTRHVLLAGAAVDGFQDGALGLNFHASAALRLQLHAKSPALFPLAPAFRSLAACTSPHRLRLRMSETSVYDVAQPRMTYQLTTAKASQVVGIHIDATLWPTVAASPPLPPQDPISPTLTFLGTGCAAPSKLRNSSGIYLAHGPPLPSGVRRGMLLDCGEGTFGQLWRQFGASTLPRLATLQCIWISHKHADHHCGLLRVLLERHRAILQSSAVHPAAPPPLVVVAPDAVLAYVARWQPAPWLADVHLVTCAAFNHAAHPLRPMLLQLTGFQDLWSVPVHHCHDSYGLVVVLASGLKLVYSGDTRPCERLIHEGFRPHVLIHEATFEDSMWEDARQKNHSTVGEAVDVGARMEAQLVLLTHFSQRYPTLPPRQQGMHHGAPPLGFAFDGMHLALDMRQPHVVGAKLDAFMRALATTSEKNSCGGGSSSIMT
ncbi:Aste57867_17535 [Aphanomyces stellatus]|uniref:ribonuclease Z n=1 Tax=Aphanomyces stellatus TaxID=120398 RepID=A0A485L7Y2_9STRA|nr:hypothetical protein As57867_017475 [Aphanomyces stellatus]VFT94288.1 Aste57867_17535 [Aphanomyces stellatus]